MDSLTFAIVKNEKALELYRTKECPHCHMEISTFEAVSILWGDGYRQLVVVKDGDGQKALIPLSDFNPQTMQLIQD
jgi:hypothetical protein